MEKQEERNVFFAKQPGFIQSRFSDTESISSICICTVGGKIYSPRLHPFLKFQFNHDLRACGAGAQHEMLPVREILLLDLVVKKLVAPTDFTGFVPEAVFVSIQKAVLEEPSPCLSTIINPSHPWTPGKHRQIENVAVITQFQAKR